MPVISPHRAFGRRELGQVTIAVFGGWSALFELIHGHQTENYNSTEHYEQREVLDWNAQQAAASPNLIKTTKPSSP
jgi:hypothetical protein